MLVMTNDRSEMSAVAMARVAKESGAAALMIVNVDDKNPDGIYSLAAETEDEVKYAEEQVDFPVLMVSLASGNLITTANYVEGMEEEDLINHGMPDRVRLYGAGDRPFFEDAVSESPILYLIHNLFSDEECAMMIDMANGKYDLVDDTISNLLEHTVAEKDRNARAVGVDRVMLWKGQVLTGHAGKQINERIEQVTGYPQDQYSDWQISKFTKESGSKHEMHYDYHPIYSPVATITVFLNDLEGDGDGDGDGDGEGSGSGSRSGGEIVYPKAGKDEHPIMVRPKKGLAVVHHNTDFDGNFDYHTLYGERQLLNDQDTKYIARRFVYAAPLPPSKRIVLPLLAAMSGGKLPRWVVTLYNYLLVKFGLEQGNMYFDKMCVMGPMLIVFGIVSLIGSLFGADDKGKKKDQKKSKKED